MSVYKSIAAVMADISEKGISKDRTTSAGFSSFKFRGIDDVYNVLSSILARHGLCILPRVISRNVTERAAKNGGALFYTTLMVEFDFVSAEDGSKHTICTVGEAMDSGDKSSNKAMSAAYKYACIQAFCIPTEGDNDPDATVHDVSHEAQFKRAHEFTEALNAIDSAPDMSALKRAYLTAHGQFTDAKDRSTLEKHKEGRKQTLTTQEAA